ncbi:MAG: beta-galactosidase, partial [Candidatus Magasanikbacteria bacterium]
MKRKLLYTAGAVVLLLALVYLSLFLYGQKEYEVEYGISFDPSHARYLNLEWKQVYKRMLDDLNPKYVRIPAMWDEIESTKGKYDFSKVDWMMNQAKKNDTKVLLVVGQKAPRWPECHVPEWLGDYSSKKAKQHLFSYIRKTVKRYRDHQALEMWQVENEPFIHFKFGECDGYREELVDEEVELVESLDPGRKILITDSGEMGLWYKASKLSDVFGTTLYRAVRSPSGFVFTYDWLPAGLYKLKARVMGNSYNEFFVSELQGEPWFTDSNPLD